MKEPIVYILGNPNLTTHELKWQTLDGGVDPYWWIGCQRESMDYLEEKRTELSRDEMIVFLRFQNRRFKELDDGAIVVWMDNDKSHERRAVDEVEAKLAKAISRQMKGLPKEGALLTRPTDEVMAQMAKAAMAVYLAAINHPVIHDIHLGKS